MLPHLDAAYSLACWLLRDAHEAEDAVQDAYLKAYEAWPQYRGGSSAAWLLKIVRNINVFIMPHVSGPMRRQELRRNGYNIESWSDGEYDFWAVSDLNRDELDMLTKLLGA